MYFALELFAVIGLSIALVWGTESFFKFLVAGENAERETKNGD